MAVSIQGRLRAAVLAFREPALVSLAQTTALSDFGDYDSRRLRYAVLWAYLENSIYRKIHAWAKSYKKEYGLYRYVRGLYNPSYRLAMFYKTHLWGGRLDIAAGDGGAIPSALPILIPSTNSKADDLRAAIARLWRDSNWAKRKDVVTLYGAALGDVGIRIHDDPDRQRVNLEVIHPDEIRSVDRDSAGFVKSYTLESLHPDPEKPDHECIKTDEVTRDGDLVVFRTLRNGSLFSWEAGKPPEWSAPYTFTPFVMTQHVDVGLPWGWAEIHPARTQIDEINDLMSTFDDRIRQVVEAVWLMAGMSEPKKDADKEFPETPETAERPMPGREEFKALYVSDPQASASPLVAPLDFEGTLKNITSQQAELERDYPELSYVRERQSTSASGEAIRALREPVEAKVIERRANYDPDLVRAQQMAVAIGGWRKYPAYEGFDLGSYDGGDLDHQIGDRPVFRNDPHDEVQYQQDFWAAAAAAVNADYPLESFLKDMGWTDARLAEMATARMAAIQLEQEDVIPPGGQ